MSGNQLYDNEMNTSFFLCVADITIGFNQTIYTVYSTDSYVTLNVVLFGNVILRGISVDVLLTTYDGEFIRDDVIITHGVLMGAERHCIGQSVYDQQKSC